MKVTCPKLVFVLVLGAAAIDNGCAGSVGPTGFGDESAAPDGGPAACAWLPLCGPFLPSGTAATAASGVDASASVPGPAVGRRGRGPSFGTTVTASDAPPPISGGTLLVTHDGNTTVAADPDRDAVYVVDIASSTVNFRIALEPQDEPGRLAEDGAGRVHIALRGTGAIVTIDPTTGAILDRRTVCPAPRGVAWDPTRDLVWVACATGELVALPSAGGAPVASFVVERDLRDVIIQNGSVAVTRFRSAELLRLAVDGTITRRDVMPSGSSLESFLAPADAGDVPGMPSPCRQPCGSFEPNVAWRALPGPAGTVVVIHQEASGAPIPTMSLGAYANFLVSELTTISSDGSVASSQMFPTAVLAVDIALSPDGVTGAMACAGSAFSRLVGVQLFTLGSDSAPNPLVGFPSEVQPLAVAFDAASDLIVQTRDPATLWVGAQNGAGAAPVQISLSQVSVADTGHAIFHAQAGDSIACASCHPEGGDDGHVWMLDGVPRRTPSLRGTIAGTAPYHWPGNETDFIALANEVYTNRMGGAQLDPSQMSALESWVESIPAPPPPSWLDAGAALRGQALFLGSAGCASCHFGPKLTNNATVNVGTGGGPITLLDGGTGGADTTSFQVPPLVGVGWRTPLMHDGCAVTVADRFGKCATAAHDPALPLSAQDVSDLTAYLESL